MGAETFCQPEVAKTSYPNTGSPRVNPGSFWIFGMGLGVLEPGFEVLGLGSDLELGSEVLGVGSEVLGLGFEVLGLGFEVLGLGFEVLALGSDVLGLGFEVLSWVPRFWG